MTKKNIGVNIVATNDYTDFLYDLIPSIKKFFLINHNVEIFVFTNKPNEINLDVHIIEIDHIPWPGVTLFKHVYCFNNKELYSNLDYLYLLDADMKIVDYVDETIFNKLVVVPHSERIDYNEKRNESVGCVKNPIYPFYFCAFHGGEKKEFLKLCEFICKCIKKDLNNNIISNWNEESYLNRYLNNYNPAIHTELTASYIYHKYEEERLPHIKQFKPIIEVIQKDDDNIRGVKLSIDDAIFCIKEIGGRLL